MEITRLPMKSIAPNTGQVPGLPANPRSWTKGDVERIAKSLKDTPELFEARPLLVYPYGGQYVILGGNLRHAGAQRNHEKDVPCIVFPQDTPTDKLKEIVVKDNGAFGSWDYDALGNEWDDLPLPEWGVPAWDASEMHLTTEGREGAEGYDEFVEKFQPKLTTDDCYTPQEVYDVVRDFVDESVCPLKGKKIVRPFFPGGNYEDLTQYGDGCIVIDNPPFSILSKILRFYDEHHIAFFLFGPHLTLFSAPDIEALTYLPVCAPITYENGAVVSTGFITNQAAPLKIWIPAGLRHRIVEVQRDTTPQDEYLIPPCVITSSRLGTISGNLGGEVRITREECRYIRNLDAMADKGKGLYGGGYIISTQVADMIEKEKEKEKEKRLHTFKLSPREQAIVDELSKVTKGQN